MGPKTPKEQTTDMDATRTEFIAKLSNAADAMRQFGNFADALAKVVAKTSLDDPEVVEALQAAVDAIPAPSKKRKATVLSGDDGGKRRKREKKPKDPNAPKAPPSAYILFQNDIRSAVRAENPSIQYRDLMGLISQQWNSLPPEKKQPYFDRVTAAKVTHEEKLAKYNASNPNHVPSEGMSAAPRKEAESTSGRAEKKSVTKASKPAPKSAETVTSSDNEPPSEGGASDDESSVAADEKGDDVGSSEESDEEPTPPPAKKAKKADKKK